MFVPRIRRFDLRKTLGERTIAVRNFGGNDPGTQRHPPPRPSPSDERHEAGDASRVPAVGDRDVGGFDQLDREG